MLSISPNAAEAIRGLTAQPGIPQGSGLKLAPQATDQGTVVELSLVEGPTESDQVVQEEGAQVFVAVELSTELDDKVLDAGVEEGRVSFSLMEQPPSGS